MKPRLHMFLAWAILAAMAFGLSGCMSTNPDDSDHPWNVPPPDEGVPNLPGMQR